MEVNKDNNDDDRVVGPQKPTAAAISEAIDTLSSRSLCADKGAEEICRHLNQHYREKHS